MATLNGTEGNDTLIGGAAADDLHGFGGNDFMQGGDGADTVLGGSGNDTISGNNGNDWVRGGTGNDQVSGGGGQDSFAFHDFGATNADVLTDFSGGWDNIHLDISAFTALGSTGRFAAGDARFRLGASAQDADDRIIYNQATGQLWYDADGNGAGAAQLIATLSNRASMSATDIHAFQSATPPPPPPNQTINGTPGNDSLVGGAGNDTINGFAGNDTIRGLGGDDSLIGGDGVDSVSGGDGNDTLVGHEFAGGREPSGPTADTLDGGLGDDVYHVNFGDSIAADPGGLDHVFADTTWTLGEGLENLTIGGVEADGASAFGNELDNTISQRGNDHYHTIEGRGGNDVLYAAQRAMSGGGVFGGDGNDTLVGWTGADTLVGGNGNDVIMGSDVFGGGSDFNTVDGGAGNDTLSGSAGSDFNDTFRFSVAPGTANADTINGFESGIDEIQLDAAVHANAGVNGDFVAGDPRFHAAAGANSAHDADDRVIFNTSTGQLWYDADGIGGAGAQLIATVQSGTVIATDIEILNGTPPGGGSTINGTSGNDSLVGTPGDDTMNGFGGNDTIDGLGGADQMDGGAGDDLFRVDNTGDVVIEAQNGGVDEVHSTVSYTLPDWVNNLTLVAGSGALTGTGNGIDNVIVGNGANNTLSGLAGNDTLAGGDGNDTIEGGTGNDLLRGDAGDDVLEPGWNNDTVDGGAGSNDWLLLRNAQSNVTVNFVSGTVTGGDAAGTARTTFTNVEGVHSLDIAFAMHITGNSANNYLRGEQGRDTIIGGGGNDTLYGSAFAPNADGDELYGGDGNDLISTFGGSAAIINGGAGNDSLSSGSGADNYVFDVAPGAANADFVFSFDTGSDTVHLDARVMPALGNAGRFSAADPRFYAAPGAVSGHDADDRVIYNTTNGTLWYDPDGSGALGAQLIATLQNGGTVFNLAETDIVVDNAAPPPSGTNGTEGNDTMIGTAGSDTLNGLGGNDFIQGQGSADTLRGGAGNDTMGGNEGADWIEGGAGNDRLTGGSGQDAFVFREFGAANADTLTDFSGNGWDSLRMDNAAFNTLGGDGRFASGDARFRAGTAAQDADDRIVFNSATGQVWYDADGNGAGGAQLVATLQAGATLVASDIWVI